MWSERVRLALQEELDIREVSATLIADHFDLSIRSLTRRLQAEGTNLRELINQERMRRAREVLFLGSRVSLEGLSETLGFSDKTALCRAFKRWTGTSPRRYASGLRALESALNAATLDDATAH